MDKSKSQLKREAVMQGKSPAEILEQMENKPVCSHCKDRCKCHTHVLEDLTFLLFPICGCETQGLNQKTASLFIHSIVKDYDRLNDMIEEIADNVWIARHGINTHGGVGYTKFYLDGENIIAEYDTGCCGSWDSDSETFPISYLQNSKEYQEVKETVVLKRKEKEEIKKADEENKKKVQEAKDRTTYERLKKKFNQDPTDVRDQFD